jgi:tRNA nucleotidyltransferase (CCA-adding enzyme)
LETAVRWEHFPHDADVGVRGFGRTKEEAFEQVAVALTAVITDPDRVGPEQSVEVACEAPDDEMLLVDWLNALVYEMAVRRLLFSEFEVRIEGSRLSGTARGEPVDVARHRPAVEIKGATVTELAVGREADDLWRAQCVVDV